jgi:hypothetical protein
VKTTHENSNADGNQPEDSNPVSLDAAHALAAMNVQADAFPWPIWGGLAWRGTHASEGTKVDYVVTIVLRRNDEPSYTVLRSGRFVGDSELVIRGTKMDLEFDLPAQDPAGALHVDLVENEHGRLGAILLGVAQCANGFAAHRVAHTVFNAIAVAAGVQYGIPLRWASMLIARHDKPDNRSAHFNILFTVGYPDVHANLDLTRPNAISRLRSNYVEGLRSNSPFYAFLCFFSLVEFMTTDLQGRLRKLNKSHPIEYIDLKGSLTEEDVARIAPPWVGKTYAELLQMFRDHRNAIAHFLMEHSHRPFDVASEDEISWARDALKVVCRKLLTSVESNYDRFVAAGASKNELLRAFEGGGETAYPDPDGGNVKV